MRNNTTEREQSTLSSCVTSTHTRLNRRIILIPLMLAVLAVLAIPSFTVSSVADFSVSNTADANARASMSRSSSSAPMRNPPGSKSLAKNKRMLEVSPTHSAFAPEPSQTGGTQVMVNFDDVPPFTNVENRYAQVKFSSPLRTVEARDKWAPPTNLPNTASPCCDLNAGFGDFVATFPQPVNDLTFTVNAPNKIGPIALIDLYQNGVRTITNQTVHGNGVFDIPFINFTGFKNITKVVVHHVTDPFGLGYDNFSFNVPAATPTPTPTPPPPPTNLKAIPDEEAIDLQWTASPGATGYIVMRSHTPAESAAFVRSENTGLALTAEDGSPMKILTVLTTNTTSLHDADVTVGVRYEYVIAAIGQGGTGANTDPYATVKRRYQRQRN